MKSSLQLGCWASMRRWRRTPSLALGAAEVSLLELTAAYAAVRAGVAPVRPTAIAAMKSLDPSEPLIVSSAPVQQQDLGRLRRPLIALLEGVVARGTGRAAALGTFSAGKTGTTEHYRDAWFVGFTHDLVAGVWVGNDDNRPMARVTGGKIPAAIWREFMAAASETQPTPPKAPAESVVAAPADMPCDVLACAAEYRSFRASDCTFQPHLGPRRICPLRAPAEMQVATSRSDVFAEPLNPEIGSVEGIRQNSEDRTGRGAGIPDLVVSPELVDPDMVYEDAVVVEEIRTKILRQSLRKKA